MRALRTYDYAVVRVVPRVERGEFVNAGIILSCDVERILESAIELDETALLALDPRVDLELVRSSLAAIPKICAGGDGRGRDRQVVGARAVSLAGCAAKHDRANLAGTHGTVRRPRRGTRASAADHGAALTSFGRACSRDGRSSRRA